MQCPSCRFENIPGLESCGRCGTSLGLATAVIDVRPPRASRAAKRVRKVVPTRWFYQARDLAAEARRVVVRSIVEDSRVPLPEPRVFLRMIVPGWAHIYKGLTLRGLVFLIAYFPLSLLGLLFWGTGTGSILLGLAFSVHASASLDALISQSRIPFPRMMETAALVSLVLAVLVYVPAGLTLMQVAAPIEFVIDAPPFQPQDVVLTNHWAFVFWGPSRGDVVLYNPRNAGRTRGTGIQIAHARFVYAENQLIDRVIGLPGDHVQWDQGQLRVNGVAVIRKPLLHENLPSHIEINVPGDRYLILPSTSFGANDGGGRDAFWKDAGLIPKQDILAGVYLRSSPLSRFWFIR